MKKTPTEITLDPEHDINSLSRVLAKYGRRIRFEKGQLLFSQNTPVFSLFWIHDGFVKLHQKENKQQCTIFKIDGKNGFTGLSDCCGDKPHQFSATALTTVNAIAIDPQTFGNNILSKPDLSQIIVKLLSKECNHFLQRLTTRLHKQLPGRVANTILYFYKLFDENETFEFPLSRTELAQFAGTTRESFIRTLAEFRNDRIINIDDRKVEINSLEIVKTLCRLG
jgi:CRP-like cAMP-binding protein